MLSVPIMVVVLSRQTVCVNVLYPLCVGRAVDVSATIVFVMSVASVELSTTGVSVCVTVVDWSHVSSVDLFACGSSVWSGADRSPLAK
jgi:hypothetical protein